MSDSRIIANKGHSASNDVAVDWLEPEAASWVGQGVLRVTSAPQRATVRVLAKTYPQPAKIAAAMETLAREFPGSAGRRMEQFVWFLNAGVPVVEALRRTPDLLQPAHCMALQLAEHSGVFPEKCWSLLQRDASLDGPDRIWGEESTGEILRLLGGLVVAWLLLTFFAIFIVPTIQEMFLEFELELPRPFTWFLVVMRWIPVVMPLIVMSLLVFVAFRMPAILETLLNRWNPQRGGERAMSPPLAVRALLADAAEARRPLAAGVGDLAKVHPHTALRRKLQLVADKTPLAADSPLAAGTQQQPATWNRLAEQGLLSDDEARALTTAGSEQSQAWLLRWFITQRVGRRQQWSSFVWQVLSLTCLALLAVIVALATISVFMVLISLIAGLA